MTGATIGQHGPRAKARGYAEGDFRLDSNAVAFGAGHVDFGLRILKTGKARLPARAFLPVRSRSDEPV